MGLVFRCIFELADFFILSLLIHFLLVQFDWFDQGNDCCFWNSVLILADCCVQIVKECFFYL
jgi:hypothetical protein